MKIRESLYPLIPLIVILATCEFLSRKELIPQFLFPAPSKILIAVKDDPEAFKTAFLETAYGSGLGLLLSIFVGLGFSLILSASKLVRLMFYPYATFFQTVPIIAIAPLLVIWFGYGTATVVASAFIVSVFPIIANSVLGLTRTDPTLLSLFRMMGASERTTLFKLRFPYALPQILGGFKISAGLAVIGAIVGEFISGSGLGGLVDAARNQQRVDRVFAAVILAAFLGIIFFSLISGLNQLLLKNRYPVEN
jgi:NitT/TauT family transport system permease protein